MVAPNVTQAAPAYVFDKATGEWFAVQGAPGPTGPSGPAGIDGPTGPRSNEITVSPTEPTGPLVDFWYDSDAPDPPPQSLAPYAPLAIQSVNSFSGPWDLEGSADTIISGFIPGQLYLVMASCTALGSTVGMKWVDVACDGTNILPIGLWINTINVHAAFPMMAAQWRATLESHTFGFRAGSGAPVSDVNDKASLVIIPMAG